MNAILISIFSLLVSLFALWLSYRNRIERITGERYRRFIEASTLLNKADNLYGQSEVSFREFWRLSKSYALIEPNDFDAIIKQIKTTKNNIQLSLHALNNSKTSDKIINECLEYGVRSVKNGESLLESQEHSLTNLKHEIEMSSGLNESERVNKLGLAISHIKQWKEFNTK